MIRFLLSVTLCLVVVSACVRDNCRDVMCYNDGLCVDGHCVCMTGYEGAQCATRWQEKFTGVWENRERLADSSNQVREERNVISVRRTDSAQLFLIDGLSGVVNGVLCEFAGRYHFKFRTATYLDSNFYLEGGQGVFDSVTGNVTGGYTYRFHNRRYTSEMSWIRVQ